ncbi:MAG: caspase (peptidase), partial [Deltaproteobacteria bacterium]|nr:caspase (peptidase) [Deltaproteobacteria bacterium]
MRHINCKLLLAFAFLLFTLPAFGAKGVALTGLNRVALVVGNSNYSGEIGRLRNPVNDVRTMARTLEQAGFSVTKLEDTGYAELREAIWDFGKQLREADAALFYFSGHGVQYNGSNYLLPLGTRLETPRHIQLQAVSENEVLAEMEGGTEDRVNI